MDDKSEFVTPINVEAAQRLIAETEAADPILANVLRFFLAQAQLQLIPFVGGDENEWKKNLPLAPVDMRFLLRVARAVFERRHILDAILAGKSPEEASGWDV